jgi:hypothetical protein
MKHKSSSRNLVILFLKILPCSLRSRGRMFSPAFLLTLSAILLNLLLLPSPTLSQSHHDLNSGSNSEVFFLNLEDGFFGCQVNASVDILQLFEISKLCDGVPHCYGGSDESNEKLKCTSE